ncbi:DUF4229 domain-containing protein [Nocardia seriolae]|uniref:Uncharacterized protein n=1 Tax=Nocardia seriolae TaxID=37332 RepID=A0A0B8N9Y8_9NOCA|nr:hypothetical protein NS506_00107 [Nocardia seriolae]MTJ60589.1 DUF4229 domain-containing protein [Nocardia seriolae]MTJ74062.1 DUF4229 domain-containing protein [Nocardia seriolae]MTJ84540.1 DUF4229 domain-containing protein [Nocardia seriolae]MTK28527.1 DUF4229 domain-containing protein [Nocardia seriolae]
MQRTSSDLRARVTGEHRDRVTYAVSVSDATPSRSAGRSLARNLALYTVARLGLVAVIAAVIVGVAALVKVSIPIVVALLFALLIAMPLSLVLFKKLRAQVNRDIAAVDAKRRKDRDQLMSRLQGKDEQ